MCGNAGEQERGEGETESACESVREELGVIHTVLTYYRADPGRSGGEPSVPVPFMAHA